jgi:hypothetical protein
MVPFVPDHLSHLLIEPPSNETCEWQLSGPQFPPPTAIQQRYCYPKGPEEYSNQKGGALWTMYGNDGKEDLEYRLLHVYFSAKRALNKGIDVKPKCADTLRACAETDYHHEGREKRQHQTTNNVSGQIRRRIETPILGGESYGSWEYQHRYSPTRRYNDRSSHMLSPIQTQRSNNYYYYGQSTTNLSYHSQNTQLPCHASNTTTPYTDIQNGIIFRSQATMLPYHEHSSPPPPPTSSSLNDVILTFSYSEDSIETNPEPITRDIFEDYLGDEDKMNTSNCITHDTAALYSPDDSAVHIPPKRVESFAENLDLFKNRILNEIMHEPDNDRPALLNKLIAWGQQIACEAVVVDPIDQTTPSPPTVPDHTAVVSKQKDESFLLESTNLRSDSGFIVDTFNEIAVSRSDLDIDNNTINNHEHGGDNDSHLDFLKLNDDDDHYSLHENDLWVTNHSSSSSFDGEASPV